MRRSGFLCVLVASFLAGCGGARIERPAVSSTNIDESGFITLFDGSGADGWAIYLQPGPKPRMKVDDEAIKNGQVPVPDAFFIEDGAIACKGYGYHWYRYEGRAFGDFVLRLQFRIAKGANSGVCLRSAKEGSPPFTGFEVQIQDDTGQQPHKHSTGAIYDVVAPRYNASRPVGEWNDLEITCDGPLIQVVLNGLKVVDTDFSRLTEPIGKFPIAYANLSRKGYIALQDHWTPIWYRNIRIRPLHGESGVKGQ